MIHGICGNVYIQFYRIPKVFKTVCDLNFDSIQKLITECSILWQQ